jgi:hypothetical protein
MFEIKQIEDRWGYEETLDRAYIEGKGYDLFESEYVIRPDAGPVDDYLEAAEQAVAERLRKQLREQFRHKTLNVIVSITDHGAYGHTSRIEIQNVAAERHYQVVKAACDLLDDPDQEYMNTIYEQVNEWTFQNSWTSEGAELHDEMLESGCVFDRYGSAVRLADATGEEISEHIAESSDPEAMSRKYLFQVIETA